MTPTGHRLRAEILSVRGGQALWQIIGPTIEVMSDVQASYWIKLIDNVKVEAKQRGRREARETGHFG